MLEKLKENESKQKKENQDKIHSWLENERLDIVQWEQGEMEKITAWESLESVRRSTYFAEKKQYMIQIQPEKVKQNKWMITWICSSVAYFFAFLLLSPLWKFHFGVGIVGSFSAMALFVCSVIAFINFAIKRFSGLKQYPIYIPTPKPQPRVRIPKKQPTAPIEAEELLKKYSCPSVLSRWMESIQYTNQGREYFQKFAQDNPEAVPGIPGEIAMLNSLRCCEAINPEGLYIPELKIFKRGDIDGISISQKGLHLLESKYLSGHVLYIDGIWKQSIYVQNPEQRFMEGWVEKDFPKPYQPDDQVIQSLKRIKDILVEFLKANPWIRNLITGTIVFTHDNTRLDITNCPVPYVDIRSLNDHFRIKQSVSEMTIEKCFEIVDLLLNANRLFDKEEVSAVNLAEDVYRGIKDFLSDRNHNSSIY